MTTPLECLHDLHASGVQLKVQGEDLIAKPTPRVTPDLAQKIRANKPRLKKILVGPSTPCSFCGGRVVHDKTFDGYLNRFCLGCGRWFTCVKSEAIEPR